MEKYIIRELKSSEFPILADFTYQAIFQRDETNLISRDVISQPEIKVIYEDFDKLNDYCFVMEIDGRMVNVVWARILCGETKRFGNVDEHTSEFAISLYKEYRGRGLRD